MGTYVESRTYTQTYIVIEVPTKVESNVQFVETTEEVRGPEMSPGLVIALGSVSGAIIIFFLFLGVFFYRYWKDSEDSTNTSERTQETDRSPHADQTMPVKIDGVVSEVVADVLASEQEVFGLFYHPEYMKKN